MRVIGRRTTGSRGAPHVAGRLSPGPAKLRFLPRLLALSLVGAVLVAGAWTAVAGASGQPDWPGMRKCGSFRATYKIWVYAKHTTCHRARRIQKEYWLAPDSRKVIHNGGSGAFGWVTLKRYPGWRCTSGSGGGSCRKGKRWASYQN